ncbi:NAD(P)/FAD-dependent oxidoreductase [Xanthobacter sp. KR7-225]|uniref:NAD(P)/FAD-dependent oxidoreductase n=1 Tax=Xanthobacter sp. KR7-225 TaxID=3156613 RepID=UPI0032B419D8
MSRMLDRADPGRGPLEGGTLADLEREVKRDLDRLNFPPREWPVPKTAPDGTRALDALVVGGGMYGQTMAFALQREGIRNLRVLDLAREGEEGPWGTYARMDILRSPKRQCGPDLGVPSLTFRAWHEAQQRSWDELYKIHRLDWLAYLLWLRRVLGIAVENETRLVALEPAGGLLRAQIEGPRGHESVYCRNVVLATGREGAGGRQIPAFPSFGIARGDRHPRIHHSADAIDFAPLRGKRVAILGANASALDNAGTALEAGAAAAVLFCRRPVLPQVNKSRWMVFPGFQHGFPAMDDASRWNFMSHVTSLQMPPPHESVLRCTRHAGFELRFAEPWTDVVPDADGIDIVTAKGRHRFDAAILATGFNVDLSDVPYLRPLLPHIETWGARVPPEEAARFPALARLPYLSADFQMTPTADGQAPEVGRIYLLSFGASLSHGALAGDLPAVRGSTTRAAGAIARELFVADYQAYRESMHRFNEAELEPTPYFVPPEDIAP